MELRVLVQLSGLVCGTVYVTANYDTSLALTKPWHSAVVTYLVVGLALLLGGGLTTRTLNASPAPNSSKGLASNNSLASTSTYLSIPGDQRRFKPFSSPTRSPRHSRHGSGDSGVAFVTAGVPSAPWWKFSLAFVLLVLSLCLRVPVTIAWLSRIECSWYSLGCLLPLLLAVYELRDAPDHDLWLEKVDDRLDHSVPWRGRRWWCNTRSSYLTVMAALALSGTTIMSISSAPASTYICLPGQHGPRLSLLYQSLGIMLDSITITCVKELCASSRYSNGSTSALGLASLTSASLLAVVGAIIYAARPDLRSWIVDIHPSYPAHTIKLAFILALTGLCTISLTPRIGLQQCVTIACFSAVLVSTWLTASGSMPAFALPLERFLLPSLAILACSLYFAIEHWTPASAATYTASTSIRSMRRVKTLLYGALAIILGSRAVFIMTRTTTMYYHPIDSLINTARLHDAEWRRDNRWEGTLADAVNIYRTRYLRPPPPNFDKWYQFAVERDSFTITNFDNIHNDLLPFWSKPPSQLRSLTVEDISQADNGIGGIQIRNHKATIAPGISESHVWMLEAVINMTASFIRYLPDMDLPFNMNDESSVMLPYSERQEQLANANSEYLKRPKVQPRNTFNSDNTTRWQPADGDIEPFHPPPQYQSMFDTYGSTHCPPNAPARRKSWWQLHRLCTSCLVASSQLEGPYSAADANGIDVCNEPDLAHLHGAYSAPSTFRPTNDIRPTFSQSRAPGFLDIRYPNPWNYAELVKYDPDEAHPDPKFASKQNTLFWRGTTTEGFASADGRHAWQGMTRQRFVNAVNFPTAQNVMLPRNKEGVSVAWRYSHLSGREVHAMLETDAAIDAPIARCMHTDCSDQIALFNRSRPHADGSTDVRTAISTAGVNFQDHWQYRYLFDMDGAGLSGRFIPFLHSNSVVVKTTSLFSEWWDGRLQPWWHYVPIDPRLTGLYSTLTYFMGVKPGSVAGDIQWAGRQDHAETIARNGQRWASKVLRREDMEIYMFRLLLEWGRLVDEERDVIGFQVEH